MSELTRLLGFIAATGMTWLLATFLAEILSGF